MTKTYLGNETILIKRYEENGKVEVVANLTEEQKKILKELI